MNNKGFTLMELLMVVLIIGMLLLIMIPSVNSILDRNKIDNINALKENLKIATRNYASDNKFTLFTSCDNNSVDVALNTLVEYDYISSPIKNPNTKEEIGLNNYMSVSYNCETKQYDVELSSALNNLLTTE